MIEKTVIDPDFLLLDHPKGLRSIAFYQSNKINPNNLNIFTPDQTP